jgi:hypothetical protein
MMICTNFVYYLFYYVSASWDKTVRMWNAYKKSKLTNTFVSYSLIKKYLRYNARSDCSKVCNMSVYIRGQRFSAFLRTFQHFKIFYKSNIKRPLVSIYCDINTLEVVEHSRSHRNTGYASCSSSTFLMLCNYDRVYISAYI